MVGNTVQESSSYPGTCAVDVLIIGGGCAGLALAHRLESSSLSVAVVEPRADYGRDRTWCFWLDESPDRRDPADAIPEVVRKNIRWRWSKWAVDGGAGEPVIRSMPGLSYAGLTATDYYDAILPTLKKTTLYRGWSADRVDASGARIRRDGESVEFTARRVVDTRPPASYRPNPTTRESVGASDGDEDLIQQFVGRTFRGKLDQSLATVMQFDGDSETETGLAFLYVLPVGDDEVLVDWTGMLRAPLAWSEAEARLIEGVQKHYPQLELDEDGYAESGLLPMSSASDVRPADDGIVRLGIRGGACRPSTGYAFLQIQRQAQKLADELTHRDDLVAPAPAGRSRWLQLLDHIFVRKLRKEPKAFPGLFARLFRQVRPDRLARFLSDVPTARDGASVVMAMPKLPFAKEAIAGLGVVRRIKSIDWQSHRRLAVPVTAVLTLVLVGLLQWLSIPSTVQVGLLAIAAAVGMAHGATDVWVGRRLFGNTAQGRARFGQLYVALAAAAVGLYLLAPGVWLVGFLALSLLHFGFGELPSLTPRSIGEGVESLVRGLMPIALPALIFAGDVQFALAAIAPSSAAVVTSTLAFLAVPTLLAVGVLLVVDVAARRWLSAAELVAVAALLVFVPPLLAFAVYFALWHSTRHLLSDVIDAPAGGAERPVAPVVFATIAPVAGALIIWPLLWASPLAGGALSATSAAIRVVFVTLGCLTVPHMLLVFVAARRHVVAQQQATSSVRQAPSVAVSPSALTL
ncbi:MAG: beta-carotene 15,15'-dioxygenase, Brp/Blh family [Planctomycetota bacterium]